jgi:hypothetical protein
MVLALDGPMPLILSNSDYVAVFTFIGDALARPKAAKLKPPATSNFLISGNT